MIHALLLTKDGDCEHQDMTNHQFLSSVKKHKLSMRDQQMILKSTDSRECLTYPSLMPRPSSKCFIFDMEHIKLVCFKDECLILNVEDNAAQIYVEGLKDQFKCTGQDSKRNMDEVTLLDFEHVILEFALENVVQKFRRHLLTVRPALGELLQHIEQSPKSNSLRKLLPVKKSLIEFEQKVESVKNILKTILSKGEDMVGLYLTDCERSVGEHEEIEMLLRSYLAHLEGIGMEMKIMLEMIEDTDQYVSVHLDTVRNEMIKMGIFLEIGSLVMGFGAVISGIFGMNLKNYMEENDSAFNSVCFIIFLAMMIFFLVLSKTYQKMEANTTSAQSSNVLKKFYTYADDLQYQVLSKTIEKPEIKEAVESMEITDLESGFLSENIKNESQVYFHYEVE